MNKDKYIELLELSARIVSWQWMPAEQRILLSSTAVSIFGITNEQRLLSLKDLVKLASPGDREFLCSIIRSVRQKNRINKFYFSVQREESELYLSVQIIAAQSDENSGATVLSGFVQDLTEIKAALQAIDEKNDQLNEISWTQSHVIRSPVATVLGLLDILNDASSEEEKAQILSWIKENMVRLDGIIRDLSDKSALL